MRVLVTGATGFVGRVLVPHLAGAGHEVVSVVRHSGKGPEGTSREFVCPDIENADWSGVLENIDAIVHLAARVHQMNDTSADPLAAFREANRDATVNLAKAAIAGRVKRFVFVSSVKAAVDQTGKDGIDETIQAAPTSPYGISKREAEQALLAMSEMETVILRPPLIYGPGVKANFLLLVKLARLPIPLPLGGIRNRRSMLGVTNLTRAIELALTVDGLAGRIFYLSDGQPLSTPELLRQLATSMHRRAILLPVPVGLLRGLARILGQAEKIDRLTESLVVNDIAFRTATGWQPEPMRVELERVMGSLYTH